MTEPMEFRVNVGRIRRNGKRIKSPAIPRSVWASRKGDPLAVDKFLNAHRNKTRRSRKMWGVKRWAFEVVFVR